jgi:YHS domain-containing protein
MRAPNHLPMLAAVQPREPTQMSRRSMLAALGAALVVGNAATTAPVSAQQKLAPVEQSRLPGVGASGYDPVAYFTQNAAVPGKPEITLTHEGVTWRFATEQHRDLFKAAPAKYLPQYGGYCAWAVASNYTATSDPEAFSVVDGKLYLNYSKAVRFLWARDPKGNIDKGNINWPALLAK